MSIKKIITLTIVAAFIAGSILFGGPFGFIDLIIVTPITNILFIIYNLIGDFGLAIILFTALVKICMQPLVRRQLHQTKLMRKIQPELVQIKKNCNGNRQLESLQTMDLYKRYNVKPFRSILSIFIQLPIFIALYTAIRVMVMPNLQDNLAHRSYSFVQYEGSRISEVVAMQDKYLTSLADENIPAEEKATYDFHPTLLGVLDLDVKAGFASVSSVIILIIAIAAAFVQYLVTRQQQPTGNSEKKKSFRQLMRDAADGKELDQADMNNYTTGQMSKIMPIMMLLIMINLPGALVLYYLLSSAFSLVQQKIVFSQSEKEMEIAADKSVIRELNKIKEAEIITNKKTGTKITRISAKDNKKKRR